MAITTTESLKAEADEFKTAYAEEAPAFKACEGCQSPEYCEKNGCQKKAAAKLDKLGG